MLAALIPSPAAAYRTAADDLGLPLPVHHASDVIPVALSGAPPAGLGAGELEDATLHALTAWQLGCSRARFELRGATTASASGTDGTTTIETVHSGWIERGFGDHRAAVSDVRYVETAEGWRIADADIFLNADTVTWTTAGAPDLRAVLVHELGHVLGIAHPCEQDPEGAVPACAGMSITEATPIMWPDYQPGAWEPRADDVEAACALYPTPSPACDPVCSTGELCRAGTCVPSCGDAGECAPDPTDDTCRSDAECPNGQCAIAGPMTGHCVARGAFGAACGGWSDCSDRLCLTSERVGAFCTIGCAVTCPEATSCQEVEGAHVCAPPPPAAVCAAQPGRRTFSPPVLTLLLASALLVRRRRGGSR